MKVLECVADITQAQFELSFFEAKNAALRTMVEKMPITKKAA